jgi:hypothetical protein
VCQAKAIDWPSGAQLSGQKVEVEYGGDAKVEIKLGFLGEGVPVGAGMTKRRVGVSSN